MALLTARPSIFLFGLLFGLEYEVVCYSETSISFQGITLSYPRIYTVLSGLIWLNIIYSDLFGQEVIN